MLKLRVLLGVLAVVVVLMVVFDADELSMLVFRRTDLPRATHAFPLDGPLRGQLQPPPRDPESVAADEKARRERVSRWYEAARVQNPVKASWYVKRQHAPRCAGPWFEVNDLRPEQLFASQEQLRQRYGPRMNESYYQAFRTAAEATNESVFPRRADGSQPTCAVVVPTPPLLLHEYGPEIDAHDVVVRLKAHLLHNADLFIGNRTSVLFILKPQYLDHLRQFHNILGADTKLVLMSDGVSYNHKDWVPGPYPRPTWVLNPSFHFQLQHEFCLYLGLRPRKPVTARKLKATRESRGGFGFVAPKATIVWDRLAYRRLEHVPRYDFGRPSTGFLAIQLALSACSEVRLYGFDAPADKCGGRWIKDPKHPDDLEDMLRTCQQARYEEETVDRFRPSNGEWDDSLPRHNVGLEHSLYWVMEREGLLEIRA